LKVLDQADVPRFGVGVVPNLARNLGLSCELSGTVPASDGYDLELALFALSHDQADLDALRLDGLCQLFQFPLIEGVAAVLGRLIKAADGNGLKLAVHGVSSFLGYGVVKWVIFFPPNDGGSNDFAFIPEIPAELSHSDRHTKSVQELRTTRKSRNEKTTLTERKLSRPRRVNKAKGGPPEPGI